MAGMIILVEAWPRRIADGVAQVVRLAGGGSAAPYRYGGQRWRAGIAALPTIIAGLAFDGDNLGAGAIPQALEIAWASTNAADLTELASGYLWLDAAVSVRVGPEGALPPVVLTGKAVDASSADGQLKIILADPAAALRLAVLTDRYAGTGGIEGPQDWEGRIKSRAWGRLWNVEGEPIDPPNNIYCFSDPRRPIASIDTVRDSGAPAAALTILPWQGSIEATWAALLAANAPQGGGVVAPSIACVKWWTEPAGTLTADLRGEIGTGYVETAPEIAARVVEARGGPAFAAGAIAAAKALRPAPCGVLVDRENDTVTAVLDDLLGGVSLIWRLNTTGTIDFRTWSWNAPVAAARSHSITRRNTFKPVKSRKLGYRANQTVMARGDIAGIVFASDISFADGSSLPAAFITYSNGDDAESLKPYEPNATPGAVIPDPSSYDPDDTYPGYIRDSDGNIRPPGELLNTALGLSRAGELTVELMPEAEPVVLGKVTTDGLGAARDTALRKAERDLVAVAKAAQEAMLSASRFQEVLRDAGIYVDPVTGKIRLHAIEEARQRISQAEVTLNGALASINLKASVTFVEFFVQEQVALAVIAPEQVADLEFLFFRQSTAEQAIEAIQAQIITKASAIELSQLGGRVTTAESKVSALEGQITQKVDNTTFGALDDRVSTAEQKIEAIPSASVIRQSVSASRLVDIELQANARRDLKALLTGDAQKRELIAAIADARNEMGARITDNGSALAFLSQQLGVRIGQAEGRFLSETQSLADDLRVVTQQLTTLNSTFTGQLGTLSGLIEDLDQAVADDRQATAQRFETVESTLGGQGEDLEELGARVEEVEQASVERDGALLAGFSRQATVQRGGDRNADAFIRDVLKGVLSNDQRARDFNQQIGFVRDEAFATLGEKERSLVQRIVALGLQLGGLVADIRELDRIVSDNNGTLVQSINTLSLNLTQTITTTRQNLETLVSNTRGDLEAVDSNTIGRVDGLEGDIDTAVDLIGDVSDALAAEVVARPLAISAAINDLRQILQEADRLIVEAVTTLTGRVGDNETTILEYAQIVDGISGRWGFEIDANGHAVGMVTNNDGFRGEVIWTTDSYQIFLPGVGGVKVFGIDGQNIVMNAAVRINGNLLVNGSITSTAIGANAISNSAFWQTPNGGQLQYFGTATWANFDCGQANGTVGTGSGGPSAIPALILPCSGGGRTVLTWNICSVRNGGDNDRSAWRILRIRVSTGDQVVLSGTPELTMTQRNDIRSWTWVDDAIPADGNYTYILQVQRLAGNGVINEMILQGYHLRR